MFQRLNLNAHIIQMLETRDAFFIQHTIKYHLSVDEKIEIHACRHT